MDSLLASLSPGLRIHQLGMGWVLIVLHLLCDALMALALALQKGLLVGKELCLRAALLTFSFIGDGLEAALAGILGILHLLNALLLDLELALLLPVVEAGHVLECNIFVMHFFLAV